MMSEDRQVKLIESNILSVGLSDGNPLLRAAFPLILLFIQLRYASTAMEVDRLRSVVIAEIDMFTKQAKASQCQLHLILAARYCLCTALDEVILLTSWGSKSGWSEQSLLSLIHRETWGGERFFIILEKMAAEPKKNLALLELLYTLLTLGFEGKYYNEDRMLREELQHRLYQLIIKYHPESVENLSPSLEKSDQGNTKKFNYLGFFGAMLAALLGIGLIFNVMLYLKAKPFLQDLRDITIAHSVFTFPEINIKNKIKTDAQKNRKINYVPQQKFKYDDQNHHENLVLPEPAWSQ